MVVILIPCKNLDRGKSRLSRHLAPSEKRDLCESFLRRTLTLATSIVAPQQVMLITDDPDAIGISREYEASHLVQRGIGLNTALCDARAALLEKDGIKPDVLVLPIDLPLADASALLRIINARADVVLATDEERAGTNLLFVKGHALSKFSFLYGRDSYRAHKKAARDAGFSCESIDDNRLAFDVDRPEHFMRWQDINARPISLMTQTRSDQTRQSVFFDFP